MIIRIDSTGGDHVVPMLYATGSIRITGTLNRDLNVTLPAECRCDDRLVINATTGAFAVNVRFGEGVYSAVAQGSAAIVGDGWAVSTGGSQQQSQAFPVGTVLTFAVSTNPSVLLGYGTWTQVAQGRAIVGLNASDPDFDTIGKQGGAKTHVLSVNEMPAHTHVQNPHTHVQDPHSHVITSQTATTGAATSYEHGALDTSSAEAEATETTNPATAVNQNATAVNQNTGGGAAHNNLQPYETYFIWRRTA